jgi:hypothetical protein
MSRFVNDDPHGRKFTTKDSAKPDRLYIDLKVNLSMLFARSGVI